MATDINRVMLVGRLTQDPDIRVTPNGANVARFSLAVNRKYRVGEEIREDVSYFNCLAWGKLTEIIKQYCQKGKQVAIDGRLQQNRWQDQQGQNRSTVEIVVETLQLLGGGRDSGSSDRSGSASGYQSGNYQNSSSPVNIPEPGSDFMDDDIPF